MMRERIVATSADGTQVVLDEYERRDQDKPKAVHVWVGSTQHELKPGDSVDFETKVV
jgi:hypothetical protein